MISNYNYNAAIGRLAKAIMPLLYTWLNTKVPRPFSYETPPSMAAARFVLPVDSLEWKLPPASTRRSRHARRTLQEASIHFWHHFSSQGESVCRPSGPIRRLASRPRSPSWLAPSASLFEPRSGSSSLGMLLLVRVFGVPPWRAPSFVRSHAACFDAGSATSTSAASESELLRSLPPLRVKEAEISGNSPPLRAEGVGLIDLARACSMGRSEGCEASPAGTEDVDWP